MRCSKLKDKLIALLKSVRFGSAALIRHKMCIHKTITFFHQMYFRNPRIVLECCFLFLDSKAASSVIAIDIFEIAFPASA